MEQERATTLFGTVMAASMKIRWWQWLPIHNWRIIGCVEAADEVPDRLPRHGAVLVGSERIPKWIIFDCPCRSGHRIMLNADKARRPAWTITQGARKKLTLYPSVDYADGKRRCHYFVRHGKILWTRDSVRL